MVLLQLLTIVSVHVSYGDESCSISLSASDKRSCDYQASTNSNQARLHNDKAPGLGDEPFQANSPAEVQDFVLNKSKYDIAWQDAANSKFEASIPYLRKAARSLEDHFVYTDLCAFLLNYGHTLSVDAAVTIYNEAEINCKNAIDLNGDNSETAHKNLQAIRTTREIRGIPKSEVSTGSYRGQKKENREVESQNKKERVNKKSVMDEESYRILTGPVDDGNLEFQMYNGSSFNPSKVMLRLGEVYVEDDFISKEERQGVIDIMEMGLPYTDPTGSKGPEGAVLAGLVSDIGKTLTTEQKILVARIRERIVNRANDFKGLDTSMYNTYRGVRAQTTSFIRYFEDGKHDIHHDNDFVNRCLSSSIVLNDGFEGGEFNLHTTKNEKEWNLKGFPIIGSVKGKAGRLALFLSQTMHSVSEVTSGNRDVFFVWCTCDVDAEYQLDDPLEPVDDNKIWKASV